MFQSLDLIFEEDHKDTFKDDSPLLGAKKPIKRPKQTKVYKVIDKSEAHKPSSAPKKARKSFAASMSGLFDTVPVKEVKQSKRMAGIDLLIRGTLAQSKMIVEKVAPEKKRVTFVMDKEKLLKIKELAKSEKAYIKDVFDRVVTEFLESKGL